MNISFIENITLKTTWNFIRPLLAESIQQELQPKSSEKKGRILAFDFYNKLKRTSDIVAEIILNIAEYKEAIGEFENSRANKISIMGKIHTAQDKLNNTGAALKISLNEVLLVLKSLNPQLEIHEPCVVKK